MLFGHLIVLLFVINKVTTARQSGAMDEKDRVHLHRV